MCLCEKEKRGKRKERNKESLGNRRKRETKKAKETRERSSKTVCCMTHGLIKMTPPGVQHGFLHVTCQRLFDMLCVSLSRASSSSYCTANAEACSITSKPSRKKQVFLSSFLAVQPADLPQCICGRGTQ